VIVSEAPTAKTISSLSKEIDSTLTFLSHAVKIDNRKINASSGKKTRKKTFRLTTFHSLLSM
jgi:uncharacterized protein YggU (UPF0235/DUF167 family)